MRKIPVLKNKTQGNYVNVVQIGKMTDTPVVDSEGNLTEDAKVASEVLEQYATTFQERNPNLYMFNCVMHLDEATPHLHIDYIPVAHGYKTGLETRNSLTKALQQMGFPKAVSKKKNETVAWQERERAYLTELCNERGIEIEVLGVKRDNLSLPEYKEAMREIESLEKQAELLDTENAILEQHNEELQEQVEEKESQNQELSKQAEELIKKIDDLEAKEKNSQQILEKHDLRASTLKAISKEVATETKKMKSVAVPMNNLFSSEEYVKVKKSDWNKSMDAFSRTVSRNRLLEKYENKISALEQSVSILSEQVEKLKRFVTIKGLEEAFREFMKSMAPKTFKQKLEEKKAILEAQKKQRKVEEQEMGDRKRRWQEER